MNRLFMKLKKRVKPKRAAPKKRVKKRSAKRRLTVFEKRICKYDQTYHYIRDVEYPSRIEKFFMIVGSPYWYNFILLITLLDALLYMHAPILGPHRLITSNLRYQIMFEVIVTTFKLVDICLTIVVDYILKLEYQYDTKRPIYIIICEILGAIPFYPPVPKIIIYCGHFLKFVRIMCHIIMMRLSLHCHVRLRVFYYIISLIISETIFAWIIFHVWRAEPGWESYMLIFEVASSSLMSKGGVVTSFHTYDQKILGVEIPIAIGVICVLFVIVKPTLCDMISLMTMEYSPKFKYIYKVYFFESVMVHKYHCDMVVVKSLMNYLSNFWDERKGCIETDEVTESVAEVFPRCLIMELSLDCSYDMFRHSQILRHLQIPIMRNLALRIQNKLYMQGDYVYDKRCKVDYMVYVQSGVIEVMSTENGETGVISLAAGTCIGETALFYSYESSVSIRCQTTSHLFLLSRSDFTFVARSYPLAFQDMLKQINNRFILAKKIKEYRSQYAAEIEQREQLVWLKATLHNYAAKIPGLQERHLFRNVYLSPFLASQQRNLGPLSHTVRYLDMLSLKAREDESKELVFIRSKCPWIFKYNSPVMKLWDFIIAALSIIMLIVQPYTDFNGKTPVTTAILWATYLFFVADIMVSLITPPSSASRATTIEAIVGERFKTVGFYLDVCSVLQVDMFGHIFPFRNEKWIFLFNVIKVWKVYRLLNKWGNRFKLNLLLQKYCIFVLSQSVYVYMMGYVLLMDKIIAEPLGPEGIQISTGVGLKIRSDLMKSTILYTFVNTFSAIFECLGVASITAANYMKYVRTGRIYLCVDRILRLLKTQPKSHLFKRLNSYVNTQINDTKGFLCIFEPTRFFKFPDFCMELLTKHLYLIVLLDLKFLKFVPKDLIRRLSITASIHFLHRHAMIQSFGIKYNEIFIITRGQARTIYGEVYYETETYVPLNLLEVIYDMPCIANVVAITEVEIVTFSYSRFIELLDSNPKEMKQLQGAIEELRESVTEYLETTFLGKQLTIKTLDKQVPESFIVFSLRNAFDDSYEEYDYYAPFDKTWSVVRHILLKVTIPPDGKFFFIWEMFRLVCSYVTCIVFFFPPISLRPLSHPYTCLLLFLDMSALFDVYLRLHVCYYDKNGLLISHPLYTAKNYLRNAFAVDFMGACPFYLIALDSPQYRMIFYSLHILQLYRLIGHKFHYFYTSFSFDCFFILLAIMIPVNLLACLIFMMDCYDWEDEGNSAVSCQNFKESTPLDNYITILYLLMSTFTCSGTGSTVNLESMSPVMLYITSLFSFLSTFLRIYVTAYLFGSYNKIYSGRYKMRDKVRRLMAFLRKEKVRPYLRKQLKIYYELKWFEFNQLNPYYHLRNLPLSLRRDLDYAFFGERVHEFSIPEDAPSLLKIFFKNVSLCAEPVIIPKNGYILTVNDIHNTVYLIVKGSVDVVAASGTIMEKIHAGAMFGNLQDGNYCRQRMSFVTNTTCKLLVLSSAKFFEYLHLNPHMRKSFQSIKNRYLYYIPSAYEPTDIEKEQFQWDVAELTRGYKKYRAYFILSWFHFIFACCIGLAVELYQIGVGEMYIGLLFFQYCLDLLHLVHQYLKFYTPYMSHEQEFVLSPTRIKAHSMRSGKKYYKLYFINLPFDLPVLAILLILKKDLSDWTLLFSLFRLNRLYRFWNIYEIYHNGYNKVASYSRGFKIFILFLLLVYSALVIATVIAVTDYGYSYYYNIRGSQLITMVNDDVMYFRKHAPIRKLELYIRYCYMSLLLHTFSHDNLYYPRGILINFLFILIFMYVTIFESFVMIQYYQILTETSTLVKVVYLIRQYVDVHYNVAHAAYVVQKKVDEAMYHYFAVKSNADDRLIRVDCPRYLRDAVNMHVYGYLFQKHPLLSKCHSDCMRQLLSHLRGVYYPINSIVVYRNDSHDTIFFVHRGEVAALRNENDVTQDAEFLFTKGDSFGYQQAFQHIPFEYTCKTVTMCEIMELRWEECKYLLEFFPVTKEVIQKIMVANVKHYMKPLSKIERSKKKKM